MKTLPTSKIPDRGIYVSRRQRIRARTAGFTLIEMMIVITIGAIIAMAIYGTLVAQQSFFTRQKSAAIQQDALRLAGTILMTSLMEANGSEGDFSFVEAESVGVRSPVGFGVVCVADTASKTIGLIDVHGRVSTNPGDSVLLYTANSWLVRGITAENPSTPVLTCPYPSGPTIQKTLQLDGSVADIPVGSPLRAFHPFTYRLDLDGSKWWLVRDDGSTVEILAGPFKGDGSGLSFAYLDSQGQSTSDAALVARVNLTLVTEAAHSSFAVDTLALSTSIRNQ